MQLVYGLTKFTAKKRNCLQQQHAGNCYIRLLSQLFILSIMNRLERKLNWLTAYALVSTLVFALFAFSSFSGNEKKENFDEITVKRINVVGENGLPRMVLSNETRQHSGRMNGKDWSQRSRPAGIIFFNNQGDECGGLVYKTTEKDGRISSGMSFTMDNYKDDQVLQILNDEQYVNGKASIQRGITINEFPVGTNIDRRNEKLAQLQKIADEKERNQKIRALMQNEGATQRLFLGRTRGNSSGLFLADSSGQVKLMIYVDEKGAAKIQSINAKGELKDVLPAQ